MRQQSTITVLPIAGVVGIAAGLIYWLSIADFVGVEFAFVVQTLLLLIYFALEINRVRRIHPDRWLVNPVVFCSIMTFALPFGITNGIYFLSDVPLALIGVVPEITVEMNKLMLFVVIGALAMWVGYWSLLASTLATGGVVNSFRGWISRFDMEPNAWTLPGLLLISLVSRLISIQFGLFGYSSSYGRLVEDAAYTQFLAMGSSVGKLALVVATLQYYTPRISRRAELWFFLILAYEIIFGFLSGFKGSVVTPLLIVILCQYVQRGRVGHEWLIGVPIAIVSAFLVIEPFRIAATESMGFTGASLVDIVSLMIAATLFTATEINTQESASFILQILGRMNLTYVGSLGIAFADENETLPLGSPSFLGDIFLSPLLAWIPRFLWAGKPLADSGMWYTEVVLGSNSISSTAMGIVTNLYFTGGALAVFCGFFFLGVMQRVIFFATQPWKSTAGAIIFISTLAALAMIAEVPFVAILISLLRELPIFLILMVFLYRRKSSVAHH